MTFIDPFSPGPEPDGLPLVEHDEPCPLCKGTGRRHREPQSLRKRISFPGIRLR